MWSLPDIKRLNDRAASQKDTLEQAIHSGMLKGTPLVCEYDGDHEGELRHELYYDIFSEDPKGIVSVCEGHESRYGSTPEGYFTCENCQRLMVENYTWEYYHTRDGDDLICLPCALTRAIDDPANWIHLTKKNISAVTFETMRKARHLIGVEMPVPNTIKFYDNAEFDSGNGRQISGDNIHAILTRAREDGYTDAMMILDAAYQFAVSIGIYVKGKGVKRSKAA